MEDYVLYQMPLNIGLGDSRTVRAVGNGTMWLNMTPEDWSDKEEAIRQVLHLPNMACNLFSFRAIDELGYLASLDGADALSETSRERWWRLQTLVYKMYTLDCEPLPGEVYVLSQTSPRSKI